ncbi:MAG: type II toxin-antitoxin system VapC family toxin [Armatimonadetes bacterium]|nr:type II toxin-antitoxin system VapC family toxin [Armatimonadota bacterium]
MLYLLDTDHLSYWQRSTPGGILIQKRLSQIPPDDYGTTIISYNEQTVGWLGKVNKEQSTSLQVETYADLHDSLRFFTHIAVWEYTLKAATIFEAFRKNRIKGGTNDLRIAAIALANNATVVTSNRRDFERVPGLRVEDWTVTLE